MKRCMYLIASMAMTWMNIDAALPPVLPNELSTVIGSFKPIISSMADTALPATLGSCVAGNPPAPCQEIGNLFAVKTSYYNITARWVSGLNTIKVNQLNLTAGENGSMHLDASVSFDQLPVSLHVDGCLPEIGCKTFIDNSNTCCGGPITVALGLDLQCNETYPYLQNIVVSSAAILPSLNIMMTLFGRHFKIFDATRIAQNGIVTGVTQVLQDPSTTNPINQQIKNLYGNQIFCTKESQNAWIEQQKQVKVNTGAKPNSAQLWTLTTSTLLLVLVAMIMSCAHEHVDHDHSHDHDHDHEIEDAEGDSLYKYIDTSKVRCLNALDETQKTHPFKSAANKCDRTKYLDSNEDDPEMILYIPFTEAVSIKSICISGGAEGLHPTSVKLFTNREDIDFTNASELPAVQKLDLVEDFDAHIDYPLQLRKFQGISNLSLFFENSVDGDQTRIYYIGLKGESKKWRHGVVECVYESRPQLSDHKVPDATGSLAFQK
ncbi:hypothetical protein THRCLA_06842 [Thraustotheca clavata]|uniref:PITH domain-containing protein n=1 Tax=Thraustotheca clavata TaxID=74557 RepID=A0A1V9ZIK5_9STRA|nr:hypothetical protein THRCLA_06842 [Thraustotheca clavata]